MNFPATINTRSTGASLAARARGAGRAGTISPGASNHTTGKRGLSAAMFTNIAGISSRNDGRKRGGRGLVLARPAASLVRGLEIGFGAAAGCGSSRRVTGGPNILRAASYARILNLPGLITRSFGKVPLHESARESANTWWPLKPPGAFPYDLMP